MTDLRKAAEMALEVLESLDVGDTYKTHNAASALRQALAQPEQKPVFRIPNAQSPFKPDTTVDAVNMNQECVDEKAKGEHEPVAWVECAVIPWLQSKDTNVYAMTKLHRIPNEHYDTPLYTAPPKREWVGLTDEEARDISFNLPIKWTGHLQGAASIYDFARAIEAKLKEKNT